MERGQVFPMGSRLAGNPVLLATTGRVNWRGWASGILPAGRVHPHGPVMPEYCACLPET